MNVYDNVSELVGGTPLVRLRNTGDATILAKLEFYNPANSVKDRIGVAMIDAAEQTGALHPGGTIVEATSGNTGIALAMVGAARGYRVILTMPDTMSAERRAVLKAFGATLVLTPGSAGMKGAVEKAEELGQEDGAVLVRQFENPANPQAHYEHTGPEIWNDTDGSVDIFVAAFGTGGTVSGVGRYLKERNPKVRVYGVEPSASPLVSEGKAGPHAIQGIGANFVPETLDRDILDGIITVDDDEAIAEARRLASADGIMAGVSSGANIAAARRIAADNPGATVVTVVCDFGERYLSSPLWAELAD